MSARTFGELQRSGDRWAITRLEPHAVIKLKALFPKVPKAQAAPWTFPDTSETAADLAWFMGRYPLAVNDDDRRSLRQAQASFDLEQRALSRILSDDYVAPGFPGLRSDPVTGEPYVVRPYQAQAIELLQVSGGLLVGDEVGLGKTYTAAAAFTRPGNLPGAVVCHRHLQRQWVEVIERFTTLSAAAIKGTKPYPLPAVDVHVFAYTQLAGWADMYDVLPFGLAAFDEMQELRNGQGDEKNPVQKGVAAMRLCHAARRRVGLTATPIYNYGGEIWNVMSFLAPDALGDREGFVQEWGASVIGDPKALGSYLREKRCFLRRTKADIGQQLPAVNKIVDVVEHDAMELKGFEEVARDLARKATTGDFHQRGEATRQLDLRLRFHTGVAKAKAVAAVVRVLVEGGEPVVLFGWHRAVYDIWETELRHLHPAMYTGQESNPTKAYNAERFKTGETDLLIMSLRSGAGLDGLQFRSSTVVFGELDWSPGIHHQCVGRVDREGQKSPVTALFLVSDDGSDPPMMDVLGLKASQSSQILDPTLGVQAVSSDGSHLRKLVERYLHRAGGASNVVPLGGEP